MYKNKFDSVVFDVDSTLVKIEGLDYIAKKKGIGNKIQRITMNAMNGKIPMEQAMEFKMKSISPEYLDFVNMGKAYIENITDGTLETIQKLKDEEVDIWILSGNFQPAIGILADYLGIPPNKVLGNRIIFDKNMKYDGFDLNNPLSKNGGKGKILRQYKNRMKKTVFIGDGSTDVEAKNDVDLFIGFGGVAYRPCVEAQTDIYVKNSNLKAVLPFIIGK